MKTSSIVAIIIIVVLLVAVCSLIVKGNSIQTRTREICTEAQEQLADLQVRYLEVLRTKRDRGEITQEAFDATGQEFMLQMRDLEEDCLGK